MGAFKPGEIRIRRRALTVLRRVMEVAEPREGCALLLGGELPLPTMRSVHGAEGVRAAGGVPLATAVAAAGEAAMLAWEIGLIWPCLNVWEPAGERRQRFQLDPREQLLAQRWCRERRLQVLGSAHSHPRSPAVPSATDLELAFAPTLQLILSPLAGWEPACWWLESGADGHTNASPLRWRMMP